MRHVLAEVVSKRKPSWGTMPDGARRRPRRDVAQVDATDPHAPAVGSARRHSSLAKVVLPEPVSPTTATWAPAGMSTSTSCEHRRAVAVGEAHAVDLDRQRAGGQRARPARARPRRAAVSRTSSTLRQPAMAIWVWSRTSPSSLHRALQQRDEEQAGDQLAHIDAPGRPVPRADGGDGRDRDHAPNRSPIGEDDRHPAGGAACARGTGPARPCTRCARARPPGRRPGSWPRPSGTRTPRPSVEPTGLPQPVVGVELAALDERAAAAPSPAAG